MISAWRPSSSSPIDSDVGLIITQSWAHGCKLDERRLQGRTRSAKQGAEGGYLKWSLKEDKGQHCDGQKPRANHTNHKRRFSFKNSRETNTHGTRSSPLHPTHVPVKHDRKQEQGWRNWPQKNQTKQM